MEQGKRASLARAVETYCRTHDNQITAEAFDRLLIEHGVIERVPSLASRGRFSHTQMRHLARRDVQTELRGRGLDLARVGRVGNASVWAIRDSSVSAVALFSATPEQAARLWKRRRQALAKEWTRPVSQIAQGLPMEQRARLLEHIAQSNERHAQQVMSELYFAFQSCGIVWPDALVPHLPSKPKSAIDGPPSRRRRRLWAPDA
jgi:hypothetical protein